MKQVVISVAVLAIAAFVVLAYIRRSDLFTSLFQSGFTDEQIRAVDREIRDYYLKRIQESPSAIEREQVDSGSTTVEVQMIKVSEKRLEGFATISLHDEVSKRAGLSEIRVPCEATLGVNSEQYLWKCQNK
jgi:hypothetical protein